MGWGPASPGLVVSRGPRLRVCVFGACRYDWHYDQTSEAWDKAPPPPAKPHLPARPARASARKRLLPAPAFAPFAPGPFAPGPFAPGPGGAEPSPPHPTPPCPRRIARAMSTVNRAARPARRAPPPPRVMRPARAQVMLAAVEFQSDSEVPHPPAAPFHFLFRHIPVLTPGLTLGVCLVFCVWVWVWVWGGCAAERDQLAQLLHAAPQDRGPHRPPPPA